jgi:hypothetical protein
MVMPRLSAESALYRSRAHYHSLAAGPALTDHLEPVEPCNDGEFALCVLDEAALSIPGTCTMTIGTSERVTNFRTVSGNLTLVGQSRAALHGIDTQLTFTVQQAGETVFQVDSTLSPTGTYTTNWHYGSMVKAVRDATLVTKDGKVIGGSLDGHTLKSFTGTSRAVTLADGTPVPQPIFPPGMHNALALMQTAVKRTLSSCTAARGAPPPPLHNPGALPVSPASNGTSSFGSPPNIDDAANTTTCNTCIAEAHAAEVACGIGCGASFGLACGCIAGIPFLYLNCHTVGEQFGQGCCPVACGPSETILGVGVVFQCCFGGDSCLNPGVPVVGGSSTAAFCCGAGLTPCNQSICCPSNAPCRDVGICCPTDQNTCVTANGTPVCCNPGEECIEGVCCPLGNVVCADGTCCEPTCHHCAGNSCVPVQDGTPCPKGVCCGGTCTNCCGLGAGCIGPGSCCSGFCNQNNQCDCFGVGDQCLFGARSCCSGLCSAAGTCCLPLTSICNGPGDCCSGFCNQSHQCDCFATGDQCLFGAPSCCSGLCSVAGTCCLPLASSCAGSGDCCSGFCNQNHQCDCFATGDQCLFGPQSCCSGLCNAAGNCCEQVGATCTISGDCCSGFCNQSNRCDCFGSGDQCLFGAQSCCSGVCGSDGLCK